MWLKLFFNAACINPLDESNGNVKKIAVEIKKIGLFGIVKTNMF